MLKKCFLDEAQKFYVRLCEYSYITLWREGGGPLKVVKLQKIDFHCFVEWFNQLFYNMFKTSDMFILKTANVWYFLR